MKQYLIIITVHDPYPRQFNYREQASNVETAISRAIKKFRKDEWAGRPIKWMEVRATFLTGERHRAED